MLDPITAAALSQAAPAIGAGLVQAGLGAYQVYQGTKDLKAAKAEIDDLRANAPSLAVPSAFSDYYNKAMDRSNLDYQMNQIARRQASNVNALSKAGGRALLGGLGSVTQQGQDAQFQATQQQMQREMQAAQVYGGAQQQAQQMQEGRYRMDLSMADQARQSAQATQQAGISAIAGGIVGAAGAYGDAYAQQSSQYAERLGMAAVGRTRSGSINGGKAGYNYGRK